MRPSQSRVMDMRTQSSSSGAASSGGTSFERHTDRYGAVHLTVPDSIPGEPPRQGPSRSRRQRPGGADHAGSGRGLRQDAAAAAAARQAIARTPANRVVAFDHAPLGAAGTLVAHVITPMSTDRDREFGMTPPRTAAPENG